MQTSNYTREEQVIRQAVKEVLILAVVFLISLALFFGTLDFIASREADRELQNRPRGLLLGWLTTITVGLILGKTRQWGRDVELPKPLVIVHESLQVLMLLLFFGILAYGSYFVSTHRALIVRRPWGILIGWFALLMFIAFFVKTSRMFRHLRGR
jgi:hypothetical protein